MSEKIKYQKGILPNLLSGYYEQVSIELKDESYRAIFEALRKEFWLQQNSGRLAELVELDKVDKRLLATADFLKNRIKELGGKP